MAMEVFFLTILGLALLVFLYFVGSYNALVRLTNQVKNAWSQIDVQLKRRHDLIPNLVARQKIMSLLRKLLTKTLLKPATWPRVPTGLKKRPRLSRN